jgi:hypothetical protein
MTPGSGDNPMSHKILKSKQRGIRENFPENLGLRVHRALSWLERAEKETEDQDAAFIFYWIAFNAAYAKDDSERHPSGERSAFDEYFERIISLDTDLQIYEAIWDRFSSFIRILLDNKYVFQPFWSHYNQMPGSDDWSDRFEKSKKKTQAALARKDTKLILTTLFDRLYVLRNQLIHGGATWNSKVNRSQVQDGTKVLAFLVPRFIDLMMENKDVEWGAPYYPVVE